MDYEIILERVKLSLLNKQEQIQSSSENRYCPLYFWDSNSWNRKIQGQHRNNSRSNQFESELQIHYTCFNISLHMSAIYRLVIKEKKWI